MQPLRRPKPNVKTRAETARQTTLAVHRGSPKFPGSSERARRTKSYLRKEHAHPNRKHKSVDYAFVTRSLSHKSFLIKIGRQEKHGQAFNPFMSKPAGRRRRFFEHSPFPPRVGATYVVASRAHASNARDHAKISIEITSDDSGNQCRTLIRSGTLSQRTSGTIETDPSIYSRGKFVNTVSAERYRGSSDDTWAREIQSSGTPLRSLPTIRNVA